MAKWAGAAAVVAAALFVATSGVSASPPVTPRPVEAFAIDPATVQREGAGYRYMQAGWVVLHIEGAPYERGRQHGVLMASEIAAFVKCNAQMMSAKNPSDAWKVNRTLVDAVFTRKWDPELLEEMRGIADGAASAGAKFDGRPIDLTDVVAINAWSEIMCLDSASKATPTGLEGKRFDKSSPNAKGTPQPARCSAFVAVGPATKDGKVVIGHITMFELYPCNFYNVMLDVKPEKGHRVLIQTSAGGVQSGLDWYQNDAGLVLTETTIEQTAFDPAGLSVGSRSRMAMQYADTIDRAVDILSGRNNGLYTNEWLLADTKRNEIAMLELGTRAQKLWRSSKGEWFGGTEGFYWGCNNTKDAKVRLDTLAALTEAPGDPVFTCEGRDCKWVELYKSYKGKIDAEFGRTALSTPPLASTTSADAKVTTSELAGSMSAYAVFGPAGMRAWKPTEKEKIDYPEIRVIPPNPWTLIDLAAPTEAKGDVVAADLGKAAVSSGGDEGGEDDDAPPTSTPAYRGTFLPAAEGDVWLAGGFGKYQAILQAFGEKGKLKQGEKLAARLRAAALVAEQASRRLEKTLVPAATPDDLSTAAYHEAAVNRGTLALHALHGRMGDEAFVGFMDEFGVAHAGKAVTSAEFEAAASRAAGADLSAFFKDWVEGGELPKVSLANVACSEQKGKKKDAEPTYTLRGTVKVSGTPMPESVWVTVEREDADEVTEEVKIEKGKGQISIKCGEHHPSRVVVDKYFAAPHAGGTAFDVGAFRKDLEHTIVVYGTEADAASNAECAKDLAKVMHDSWVNEPVAVVSDAEVTDDQLRGNHVVLVGTPRTNRVAGRFASVFPCEFGGASVKAGGKLYASASTSVIASGDNPLSPKYGFYLYGGNSGEALYRLCGESHWLAGGTSLVVFPSGGGPVPVLTFDPAGVKVFGE